MIKVSKQQTEFKSISQDVVAHTIRYVYFSVPCFG